MKKKQDQWIDEVMGSLQGIQAAECNKPLHTRVVARLQQQLYNKQPLALKWVYVTGGFFAIILLLNVLGWNNNSSSSEKTTSIEIETVMNDYNTDNSFSTLP